MQSVFWSVLYVALLEVLVRSSPRLILQFLTRDIFHQYHLCNLLLQPDKIIQAVNYLGD